MPVALLDRVRSHRDFVESFTRRQHLPSFNSQSQFPFARGSQDLAPASTTSGHPDTNPRLRGKARNPRYYRTKPNRRKVHAYVYEGPDHVNPDSIEALASKLVAVDPAQAERFFGNRVVAGGGAWLPEGIWESRRADVAA